MKLIFHGGAREVGRNCVEVVTKQGRFLLDAGTKLGTETKYPSEIKNLSRIDAGLLSHGHLDHCGGWPYLHSKGLKCPIYMTPVTEDFAKILLRDFYKIESLTHIPPYKKESIFAAIGLFKKINYSQSFEIKDTYFKFYDAGHIPGSSFIYIESDGKSLVYTGDIKLNETRLLKGADLGIRNIDALVMETTYGKKEHLNRQRQEREFLEKTRETIKRKGNVFIPAFSVGRTQELILILNSEKWNIPVYVDGMGKDMTEIVIHNNAAKDVEKLKKARNKVIYIAGRDQRERAMKKQGIFIASAGMLTGGSILEYLKEGHRDPKNSILLTGYVDTGTNGRLLLDEGSIFIEGRKTKVQAEYHQYDFSAHAGLSELKELVHTLRPKKVILIHGELESMESFADYLRKKELEVYIPETGSEINI